jgi:hypothetical protein
LIPTHVDITISFTLFRFKVHQDFGKPDSFPCQLRLIFFKHFLPNSLAPGSLWTARPDRPPSEESTSLPARQLPRISIDRFTPIPTFHRPTHPSVDNRTSPRPHPAATRPAFPPPASTFHIACPTTLWSLCATAPHSRLPLTRWSRAPQLGHPSSRVLEIPHPTHPQQPPHLPRFSSLPHPLLLLLE